MTKRIHMFDTEYAALVDAGLNPESPWVEEAVHQVRQQVLCHPDKFIKAVILIAVREEARAFTGIQFREFLDARDEALSTWPHSIRWCGNLLLGTFTLGVILGLSIAQRLAPYLWYWKWFLKKKFETPLIQKLNDKMEFQVVKLIICIIGLILFSKFCFYCLVKVDAVVLKFIDSLYPLSRQL